MAAQKKKATFAGAMAKAPKKAWESARAAEPGGKRELPQIDDGTYPCRMKKMKCDTSNKDGTPYVSITLVVLEGEFEGVVLDKFHSLKDWEQDLPRLVKTLKAAGYEFPDNITNEKAGEFIESIAEDVNSSEPEVMVAVENREYAATKDGDDYKKGDMIPAMNVYINRPRSEEEGAPAAKPAKKAPVKKARK